MFSTVISNYIKAGFSGIYVVSHEEARVEMDIAAVAGQVGYRLHAWSVTSGLQIILPDGSADSQSNTEEPMTALAKFRESPERSVLLLRDFHLCLPGQGESGSPVLLRTLRDLLSWGRQSCHVLIILGCQLRLPPEIEKDFVVVEYGLPDRELLKTAIGAVATAAGSPVPDAEMDPIVDSAAGMTLLEAENAAALSHIEAGRMDPVIIHREKVAVVKKSGILEVVQSGVLLESIGGLDLLKADLNRKRNLFSRAAREFGLATPRGLLVVGQPGTGKSLTATATSSVFGIPLLRLEAGSLFGSLVGQSEANWRRTFETVRAVRPCTLWVDEVESLLPASSGASTDGGTTQRVTKAILQDMQMRGDGIFFIFTANDIDRLPDPLIDRLDVWYVDLPTALEREQIWSIHLSKRGRNPDQFDLPALAELTDGFSGRQIEVACEAAMTITFNRNGCSADRANPVTMEDCREACTSIVATSKLMGDQLDARRERLKGRARPASSTVPTRAKPARKFARVNN